MNYFRPLKGCILSMDHQLSGPDFIMCISLTVCQLANLCFAFKKKKKKKGILVKGCAVLFKYLYTGACPSFQLHQ